LLFCSFGFRFMAIFPITLPFYPVIIHAPGVGQKAIVLLKIIPASRKTAQDVPTWHIMAALFDPRADTPERDLWGRNSQLVRGRDRCRFRARRVHDGDKEV
jgi:hypothetical protein